MPMASVGSPSGGDVIYSAMDVANFYISFFDGTEDPMTKTRVEMFVFFAQVWSLVKNGHPLFNDDIRAYKYGPVVRSVLYTFYDVADCDPLSVRGDFDIDLFSDEDINAMLDVAMFLRDKSTAAISDMTHVEGGPWDAVHSDSGEPAEITDESILEYYRGRLSIPDHMSYLLSKLPVEGRIDENGMAVLPEDWD